ncbi:hypothetical protein [Curtobacterium flaccumfaciens]|uniref:hypothetical protein n=1 Tax=Curtobacterium flaccumfaciens TaxID=2035 RepID=UPI0021757431|nr:hypothetical protein [Curtobacterium flaccumfaciens]MCS5495032.1 hypothetical protein [Curtobacterium flaccumfaciens pv. flaccumfaciens]
MSIPDFDVEPAVGPRFWPHVLGVVAAVTGVLAVIGWPLPIVSGRTERAHAWERTVQGVQDWLAFDGWRLSGASWVYGAASIAALTGAITLLRPEWSSARKFVVVVAPTGTLLVVGPAVQWAAGLPWSNYGQGSTGGIALGILAASVGGAVVVGLRALIPRSVQPEDDVNPPPRGVR